MACSSEAAAIEVKRKNILHHNVEADFFEAFHPEGSSSYEKAKVLKDISLIARSLNENAVCIDIGCGTGFVTSFELPRFENVVALDICKKMLTALKRRLSNSDNLNLVLCDAENVPLRDGIADAVSASSVLHHLPKPSIAILEMSRILRRGGFLYISREPNDIRFRRLFALLDVTLSKLAGFAGHCIFPRRRRRKTLIEDLSNLEGLNYEEVDIHYRKGFDVGELSGFLLLKGLKVISAHSYHWLFSKPAYKANFMLENAPLSKSLGRYVCVISRKPSAQ